MTGTLAPSRAEELDMTLAGTAPTIDELVGNALQALDAYAVLTQDQAYHIVNKASVAAFSQHGRLAELAIEETGRGVFEDKAVKNVFASEHIAHSLAGLRTIMRSAYYGTDGDHGR